MPKSKFVKTNLFTRDAEEINVAGDRVTLAFSSEHGVERWLPDHGRGLEILDHDPKHVRLGRLRNRAAALVNHDPDQYVGDVVEASIDGDKKGRAVVAFAPNSLAQSVKADVAEGFRGKVSVGYRVHKFEVESRGEKKIPIFRAIDWEPHEISFVTVPADDAVGVGRSLDQEFNTEVQVMTTRKKGSDKDQDNGVERDEDEDVTRSEDKPAAASPSIVSLEEHAATKARSDETDRVKEIRKVAKMFSHVDGFERFADQCIGDGASIERFREEADKVIRNWTEALEKTKPRTHLDMDRKESQSYSVVRAIRALIAMKYSDGVPGKIAPFEMKCSELVAQQMDVEPRGIMVPFDVQQETAWNAPEDALMRAMELGLLARTPPMGVATASTVAAGLKGTMHMAANFIEALRPATVVIRAGATLLPGLVQDVSIPKQTGRAGFTWLAEDDSSVDTEVPIGLVTLSPKTVSGSVPITRKLMKQSAPAVEQLVRSDLVNGAAEAIDLGALRGTGATNQPLGVVGTSGVLTQTVSTPGSPTFAELVGFETKVAAQNALRNGGAYVTTPAVAGTLKTTSKDTGSGMFLMENGMANGYPVLTSSQLTANDIIFGGYSQVLIGMWGVLDLVLDTATNAAKNRLTVRAFQDIDVTVRHAQAFCINA